ncbi:MAG: hypothetical protein CMI52_03445 [Parcubacteria group bacterium]|nr:hypothetical protein [Parcubacteria group bacterium]|tara:strand:- start:2615 stop:2959 length:345 start_codon:yes stop_codon:yes gene_type:complete
MLEEKDLNKIQGMMAETMGEVLSENVIPALDQLNTRVDSLEKKFDDLDKKVNRMPDRDYIDRAVAELKGSYTQKLRTEDQKVNLLIKFLKEKDVLGTEHIAQLKELQVFPALEL